MCLSFPLARDDDASGPAARSTLSPTLKRVVRHAHLRLTAKLDGYIEKESFTRLVVLVHSQLYVYMYPPRRSGKKKTDVKLQLLEKKNAVVLRQHTSIKGARKSGFLCPAKE